MPKITGTKTKHTRVCWRCRLRKRLNKFVAEGKRGICKECHRIWVQERRRRIERLSTERCDLTS